MASSDVHRKLTAILVTDVVGYSRLMGDDPEGTLKTLTEYREIFSVKIQQYKGRVVNAPGDSLLADFTSVLDAVSCAVDIQRELAERNQELPDTRRMEFRIGVNLGDVLVKDGDIYGDGVNVAARLESMADPGGICISADVHTQVKTRLPLYFELIGEQRVKNIAEPVKTYRVLSKPGAAAHRVVGERKRVTAVWHRAALATAVILLIAVVGLLGWNYFQKPAAEADVAASGKAAVLPLPDRPSIVVLPFRNLSGNPRGEVYSDGLTVNLIMQLSRLSGIFVISDHTSYAYKQKTIRPRELGQELGVRYVASGSVQIEGKKIRVIFSLTDTTIDRSIIAASYDRKLDNWFDIQDDIVRRIIISLQVNLSEGEQGNLWGKNTKNLKTMTLFWQGMEFIRQITPESNRKAVDILEKAKALDPNSAVVFSALGYAHFFAAKYGWSKSPQTSMRRAAELARKAIAIDPNFSDSYTILGAIASSAGDYERSIALGRKAVELSPNGAEVTAALGMIYNYAGQPKEAIKQLGLAMRLSPRFPTWYSYQMGLAQYLVKDFSQAIHHFEQLLKRDPKSPFTRLLLTASFVGAERMEEAHGAAKVFRERNPAMQLARALKQTEPFRGPAVIKGILERLKVVDLE